MVSNRLDSSELRLLQVNWQDDREAIKKVREQVFIHEMGISPELEWEAQDRSCIHVLALYKNDPIGTGRLLDSGFIGRMAVNTGFRRQYVGSKILTLLIQIAMRRGHLNIQLHAQTQAIGFYSRFGFISIGDVFMEAGMTHQKMILKLPQGN